MKPSNKQLSSATDQLKKVDSLVKANRFKEALAELREVEPIFNSKVPSSEIAQFNYLRGFVLWQLGEKKQALELAQAALDLYLSMQHLEGIAKSQNLVGWVHIDLGNLKEAEEHLQMAVSSFKMAGDWQQAARALNKIAHLQSVVGKLNLAKYFNEQARGSALKANDLYYGIVLRGSLGFYQLLDGRWRQATANVQEYFNEAKKAGDYFNYVISLLYLGNLNRLGGRFRFTRRYYEEAIELCKKESFVSMLKIAYEYLGELCIQEGRFAEAEENLKKALEIGERVSPYGSIMTQCWRLMGDLRLAQKEYDRALDAYGTCRSYLIKLPEKLEEGAMYRGMGISYIHKDQLSLAQTAFKKALEIFEACENSWELAKTYVETAESGAFALAELRPKLAWAKGVFQELEHPSWEARVEELLGHSEASSNGLPLRLAHEMADRQRVVQALSETKGNISHAAGKLGISRPALHYKIKRYKLAV